MTTISSLLQRRMSNNLSIYTNSGLDKSDSYSTSARSSNTTLSSSKVSQNSLEHLDSCQDSFAVAFPIKTNLSDKTHSNHSAHFSPNTIEQVCRFDTSQPPSAIRLLPTLLIRDNNDLDCGSVSASNAFVNPMATCWQISSNLSRHPCFNGKPLMLESALVDLADLARLALPYSPMLGNGSTCIPSRTPSLPTIKGSVLVRNIAFTKDVFIRMTTNGWATSRDIPCRFESVVSPTMGDFVGVDRFGFNAELDSALIAALTVSLPEHFACSDVDNFNTDGKVNPKLNPDIAHRNLSVKPVSKPKTNSLDSSTPSELKTLQFRIELALCFKADNKEHWDNNNGKNFVLTLTSPDADVIYKQQQEQLSLHRLFRLQQQRSTDVMNLKKTQKQSLLKPQKLTLQSQKSLLSPSILRQQIQDQPTKESDTPCSVVLTLEPFKSSPLDTTSSQQSPLSAQSTSPIAIHSPVCPRLVHSASPLSAQSPGTHSISPNQSQSSRSLSHGHTFLRSTLFQPHRRVGPQLPQGIPPIVKIPLFVPPEHDSMVPVTISLTTGIISSACRISSPTPSFESIYSSSPPSRYV
ncbi:hypothetical protein BDV3_004106 [Batrachochytrium dendrobatidis]